MGKIRCGVLRWRRNRIGKIVIVRFHRDDLRRCLWTRRLLLWNRRYREYTEKIKTGSPLEIAKVLRDLLVLKGDKELSFGERKMLDTARSLLVKELSIARAHPEEKIIEELNTIFAN